MRHLRIWLIALYHCLSLPSTSKSRSLSLRSCCSSHHQCAPLTIVAIFGRRWRCNALSFRLRRMGPTRLSNSLSKCSTTFQINLSMVREYRSIAKLTHDEIEAHIVDPDNNPLPERCREQFGRVLSAARLLDDYPDDNHVIRLMRAKYDVSPSTVRRDIAPYICPAAVRGQAARPSARRCPLR